MGANYAEAVTTVTTWLRSRRVTMLNPYGGTAQVQFEEERCTLRGESASFEPTGTLKRDFDASRVIPLIDPTTGLPTGQSMTEGEIYAALYSVYVQMAAARDAA